MSYYGRGTRVILNKKWRGRHKGARGTVTDLNRGNVYVQIDNGPQICTRMTSLTELTLLEQMAEESVYCDECGKPLVNADDDHTCPHEDGA